MTVTVAQIQTEFPEFSATDAGLIGVRISEAERLVARDLGDHRDDMVKYLACHMIALMPHGEPARLVASQEPGGASTTYERQYQLLKRSVVVAPTVL